MSANNLTYLHPVDVSMLPKIRYGESNPPPRRKKDPNYDYPDIQLQKKINSLHGQDDPNSEKPIYAEVSDLKSPDPDYTKPDFNIVKPRVGPPLMGVPGYQPSNGLSSNSEGSHDGYSSLGVQTGGDSTVYQSLLEADQEQADKPPIPQYAEVIPENNFP